MDRQILQTNLKPHSSQKWAGAWHWILHSQVAMLLLFNPPGNISRFSRGIGIGYVSHGKNYCPNIVFCSRSLWSIIWKIVFFFKQKAVEQCFDDLYLKNPQISKQHICKTICMMYRFLEVLKLWNFYIKMGLTLIQSTTRGVGVHCTVQLIMDILRL